MYKRQTDFEQHLETNSRIAEVGASYQSFNVMTKEMCIRDRFKNMEEVQQDMIKSAKALYKEYVNKGLTTEHPFKGVGTQYILFEMCIRDSHLINLSY